GVDCGTVVCGAVVVEDGADCVEATCDDSLEHETSNPTPTVSAAADRTENRSRMEYDGSREVACC
ncbi:MAG: hypothetical protein NTX68_09975, partial [Rhodococcus sp.]